MRVIACVSILFIWGGSAQSAPIHAGHEAFVLAVAVTDDGKVAASADANGSLRLWPALDGSREPVVVAARAATALAIARDREQLVIAGLDAVGQLRSEERRGGKECR